jgi:tRNA (guanine37-N1)-methyltransferase
MKVHVFCTLPRVLDSPIDGGIIRKARDSGALELLVWDMHELSPDPHHKIDDCPYGGGPGMVLRVDVVEAALEAALGDDPEAVKKRMPVVLLTPQGERFTQEVARELVGGEELAFICGRYEGVDERVRDYLVSRELSLGDFVLSGGEIAAAAVIEALARLLPGVLGNEESLAEESFSDGLLEYPQYTRPASHHGRVVPEILLSGDHARIKEWRGVKALERTRERRPDLLPGRGADPES